MDDKGTRRQFTREFKVEAVEMVLQGDKKATDVARNLGIRVELLYRWKNEYMSNHEHSFPGPGHLADPEEDRIRQLERELASVKEDREILKNALAIFSKKRK